MSEKFHLHFESIYGGRWPRLLDALQEPTRHVSFQARPHASPYFLDEASLVAASLLPLGPDAEILDMCAAPGGKSLILASRLGPDGRLVSNELSRARRDRLKRVLEEHLPQDLLTQVRITGFDASKWSLHAQEKYDAILLDAPCSSERHLIHQPKLLKEWTISRTKSLAMRQYALLAAASLVVKSGGYVLYCTCSISPKENDEVIERLLRKKKYMQIENISTSKGEPTQFGWMILPDTTSAGPMYCALLRREKT